MTTLLITGVSSYWGQRVAAELAQQSETGLRLLGLDRKPPQNNISSLDFIRGNLSDPLMVDLLTAENVETVLYLDEPVSSFQFLQMCAEAGVHRVILKSSTTVYGAHPGNSLYLAETHALDPKPHGSLRPLIELETFANGLTAQFPGLSLTVLRYAHILGPTAETPLARFLLEDRAPTLLGFNPLLQLIHEDDVIAALVHASLNDLPGVYNIAAEDAFPLNKILALAGKLPLPIAHPLAASLPTRLTPFPLEYLRYPCLASLDRMNNDFGLTPVHIAEEIVAEFANEVRRTRYMPDALEEITNPIRDLVQSLRRTNEEDDDNE